MPNRLATSTSPYLLQHAENPVDWYPWGDEAFASARERDVPVMLSVGYAACHWCHVMAHESFEDAETAAVMNAHFVNIKVDREERPDVDRIYMDAVQAMNGHGGWPMTVFLTPDARPFYAGTYFPKDDRPGHPSFVRVLRGISEAWSERRDDMVDQAERLTVAVRRQLPVTDVPDNVAAATSAVAQLSEQYDPVNGGFGRAPKFPQVPNLELLARAATFDLATAALPMLHSTLDAMADGGINDHVGGGFARYSVDSEWLVPHFEKMLYDNALLARIYLRSAQLTGSPRHTHVARRTLDYLIRDLRSPEGAFYSAEDADSEGVEGKYYVWDWDELLEVLDGDEALATALGGSPNGNFEGSTIINFSDTSSTGEEPEIAAALQALAARRQQRVRPATDDKIVAAWNGLAIRAFAEAGVVLGDPGYTDTAIGAAEFVLTRMRPDGRLARSWRDGTTSGPGFCDDYGAMAIATLTLFQVTGEARWAEVGLELVTEMKRLFAAPDGGFFATGNDAEELIHRPMNLMDNPTPSDNALAAEALVMAAGLTGTTGYLDDVQAILGAAGAIIEGYPSAAGHLLAVGATVSRLTEVAIVGSQPEPLVDVIWDQFRPECVVAIGDGATAAVPLLRDRPANEEEAVAYVCEGFVCLAPVATPTELREALR